MRPITLHSSASRHLPLHRQVGPPGPWVTTPQPRPSRDMSCNSGVPFNFGQASGLDTVVYGAARPGAKTQRCYSPGDKVTEPEVAEWSTFMQAAGVKRVVGLLSDSELDMYTTPPVGILRQQGMHAVNINLQEGEVKEGEGAGLQSAMNKIAEEFKAAEAAGEKIVVHCWGGSGRTGKVLAAWLVLAHGLTPEAAAAAVETQAKECGTSRRVDIKAVQQLLGAQ